MDLMTAVVFFVGLAAGGGGAFFFTKKGTVATEPTVPKPVTSIVSNSEEINKLKQEIININKKHTNEKKQLDEEIVTLKELQGQLKEQLSNIKTKQADSSNSEETNNSNESIVHLKSMISQKEETIISLEKSEQAMAIEISSLKEKLSNSQEDINAHIQNSSSEHTKLLTLLDEKDKIITELELAKSQSTATTSVRKPNSEIKLLVVDDSKVVRKQLTNTLKKAGFIIELAEDGRDALNKLQADNSYDLVVTDLEMPNVNGHELIKAIHEDSNLKSIPVMAITGHEEISINVVENEGLVGVHKKPWIDEVLIKKIQGLSNLKVL